MGNVSLELPFRYTTGRVLSGRDVLIFLSEDEVVYYL